MAAPTPSVLRGDEAALYRQHHKALLTAVARRVRLSSDLVEDACQTAWARLLRRQPDRRPELFGWLVTVAVHEAYHLTRREHRALSLDAATAEEDRDVTLAAPVSVDDTLEARRALRALASLDGRQRRYATLRAAGFSYTEIQHMTGATHTNVNKHLVRATRHLRTIGGQAA